MLRLSACLTRPTASLRRYTGTYGAHAHDHAQVLVGLQGCLQLEVDGRSTYVDATCALVVPAGAAHGYLADTPAQVLVIDTPAGTGLDRMRRFVPPPHWRQAGARFDAFAAVQEIAGTPAVLQRRPLDLARLNACIDAQLHAAWPTARLAAMCRLSPQQFHARFLELTGLPPAAHVRLRRLDSAERLLRTGMPLEAVALQVGYASASALAYALRRERGVGARAIRQSH
jgi:AraC-like DNA-binding protein